MATPEEVSALVKDAAEIKAQIKALQESLKSIEAKILAAGAGKYSHGASSCLVIHPKPKFAPNQEAIEKARELIGDDEDGKGIFRKLFVRSVVWSPVEGARNVASALLTPGKLKKFLDICEVASKPFLKW